MPIKNFFSGRKPEENEVVPSKVVDEGLFDTNFDGMQSLDMYADEDSAAGGFAALLQPEDDSTTQDGGEVYYDENASLVVGEEQNVGETVYQNLFAEESDTAQDFFAPQQDDFEQSDSDFFAAQPEEYAQEPVQGDDFFAAQPMAFDEANVQQTNDFFAAQPQEAQAFADATDTNEADAAFQPQDVFVPNAAYEQAAPVFDMDVAMESMPDGGLPFDIAVPEQTQSLTMEFEEEPTEGDENDLPKRKFAPVFSQPVPSALDELRAGIVKPASPISAVAATQIPVLVTAVEAAAAEAAAKTAVEVAAADAAVAEDEARAVAERIAAETEAEKFGYEDPTPAEMGFGYVPPVQGDVYGYDNAQNGPLTADEFHLPVTEDVPRWQEQAASPTGNEYLPGQQDSFALAQDNAFASFQPDASMQPDLTAEAVQPQGLPFFDYDNAPIEGVPLAEDGTPFDDGYVPATQGEFDAFAPAGQEQYVAQTPADYANNLQSMFNKDDTYAAMDAVEQGNMVDANANANAFDTACFEAPAFEDAGFAPQDGVAAQDYGFSEVQTDGFGAEDGFGVADDFGTGDPLPLGGFTAPDAEYTDFEDGIGDDFGDGFSDGFDASQEDVPMEADAAFNPFQSEEWLDDGEDRDDKRNRASRKFGGDDGDRPVRTKSPKSGGGGGKKNLPLMIILIVLVLAIVGVAAFLLWGGDGKTPAQSSSAISVAPPSSSSSEPVSSVPAVDPIPRDEWYMKLVNHQNVLTADFKVDAKNNSDGVPVDTRIVEALNKMISEGNATGLKLMTKSGYRTYDRQKTNYEYQVNQQVAAGKNKADAETAAAMITAPPGASEHNLGLAVDIMSKTFTDYDTKYEETAEAKWLLENAANYGFILRYSKTGKAITGFEYEPWHYRYVGVEQAQKIKASGLTLEEYLAQDAPTGIPEEAPAADAATGADSSSASTPAASGASSSSAAQ